MKSNIRVLVIDDEVDMLSGFRKILEVQGYKPITTSSGQEAMRLLKQEEFDIVLTDLLMPDLDGMQILETIRSNSPGTPVIIFSAYGTVDRAVTAMRAGAFDFLEKPFDTEHINIVLEKAIRQRSLYQERNNLIKQLEDKFKFDNIVGKSMEMKKVFEMIEHVASSDANILITGESGTGKELIARSIHAHSERRTKPFVPVNCGAFPENLFEAELFGYEKGSFTGASKKKIGLLEYADGGTFFMDEVCELQPALQAKLLRTLQDRQLRHIGGNELIHVDVRLISATNQNLKKALSEGRLREDLYYRLNVINIQLPPLRERKGDIRLLAEHFLKKSAGNKENFLEGFSGEAMSAMENYSWPGNVRELENAVERAVALARGEKINISELPPELNSKPGPAVSFEESKFGDVKREMIDDLEKKYLSFLLKKHKGNVTKMAVEAGMTRRNIHRLLKQHGFDTSSWRR